MPAIKPASASAPPDHSPKLKKFYETADKPFMKAVFVFSILALFASGCSIEVSTEDLKKKPSKTTPHPLGIKYSGGANSVKGSNVDAEFSIGLKDRQLKGSTVDAQLTISANRPSL